MSKNKKNAKNNQNTKGYSDKTENNLTDSVKSVPQNDNGSHAENKNDRDCQ